MENLDRKTSEIIKVNGEHFSDTDVHSISKQNSNVRGSHETFIDSWLEFT